MITYIVYIHKLVHPFFHSMPPNDWGPHYSRGWCTKDQLLQLYNGNRPLVEQLIMSKTNSGEFREHPDMPNDPGMTLYYVLRINMINKRITTLQVNHVPLKMLTVR